MQTQALLLVLSDAFQRLRLSHLVACPSERALQQNQQHGQGSYHVNQLSHVFIRLNDPYGEGSIFFVLQY